ncbi:hypothetical protein JK636_22865 [Clostridium sp. YIM B02515]|uniref:Uncharacterized protein n=1 Tax=Clostridium rhizosphaerae TaxID=2803861 RepID=A0ABS1TGR3_9CLOT|nr:hypothetical protein [Clostridium rhizosphaerae]MBL4938550.1 hypothetical protein [Clostridium rhizosphaerae]
MAIKDKDISYSGCGLPFYIGGEVDDIKELAYSSPFPTVKDAIHYTGMLLDNAINKNDDGV